MQLIIFIGIQGAGKSTFYQQYFYNTHLRLNGDMLKTRHRERLLFEACLASKTKVVLDRTNASKASRQSFIVQAKAQRFEVVAYYFNCPLDEALVRNAQRSGKARVPDVAVKGTFRQLEVPDFAEGFARIYDVTTGHQHFFVKERAREGDEI